MGRLFGTDGIRGVAGKELNIDLAVKCGRALGTVLSGNKRPRIIIASDTRISKDMLSAALGAGLMSVGVDVAYIGCISTPAVAYLVRRHSLSGGIMISASHNSAEYNGIKIFGADGFKLPDSAEENIEKIILGEAQPKDFTAFGEIGREFTLDGAACEYSEYLKKSLGCDLSGYKIALDLANGSATVSAHRIFADLGAECTVIGNSPDGMNINRDCGSTQLDALIRCVKENGLDVGLAFDGDADRLLAVDECGEVVDGDYIMAILALDMKERGRLYDNTVVGTVMTNLGFKKFCEENGIQFIAERVGDRYVLERMNRHGYALGGEQSGHIILSEYATTGDGQLTALALMRRMRESGLKLSELKRVMRKYPQYMVNVSADAEAKRRFAEDGCISELLSDAEKEIEGGRLLVRVSGTEPKIRIMAEGDDVERVKRAVDALAARLEGVLRRE